MSKTIVFARKTVTYAHYEMTKEEFFKDHCDNLRSTEAKEHKWKQLCAKAKKQTIELDEEENDDEDLDYDFVEEFINDEEFEEIEEQVYSTCEIKEDTEDKKMKEYVGWTYYQTFGGGPCGGYLKKGTDVCSVRHSWNDGTEITPLPLKRVRYIPEAPSHYARVVVTDAPMKECGSCSEKSHNTHNILTQSLGDCYWCEKCAVAELDQCSVCGQAAYKQIKNKHTHDANLHWRPMTKEGLEELKTNPAFCF